ncbi:hypothetical protein [Ureibacillus acetophenoni]|uniref:Uncharacterized protein n=1 Tax=Ureibacillus acetophenoni TaxID=614649 RepID=A0A285UAW6_9BACL|nr:hypothetical protein [Ureibacillus acetophenoni]SOC39064.1 hypothetical protein SAMN05877842_10529 [Ureibacillus acetophenoni]
MGGVGSGRYGAGYVKSKDIVENRLTFSIRFFSKAFNDTGLSSFTLHSPTNSRKVLGSGIVNPDEMYISLSYSNLELRIYVDQTPCHYGGVRYWFICSSCGRRSSKLYGDNIGLACRTCCNLNYYSQQHTKTDSYYYQRKAEQVARKIDKEYKYNLNRPFPAKPKYMKWIAYQKLWCKFKKYSELSFQYWLRGAYKFLDLNKDFKQ